MIKYKLTTQGMATHNGHTWVVGEKQTITIAGEELCTEQVLHYYDSPELAVLFNPIHANIIYPRLWQVECDQVAHDGLKGGAKWMVLERELPLPKITLDQSVAFSIYCARDIAKYADPKWLVWATDWLAGTDRSVNVAASAANAATVAANAAASAANAAANAANAANAAASAANAAASAANAAAWDAANAAANAASAAAWDAANAAAWAATVAANAAAWDAANAAAWAANAAAWDAASAAAWAANAAACAAASAAACAATTENLQNAFLAATKKAMEILCIAKCVSDKQGKRVDYIKRPIRVRNMGS